MKVDSASKPLWDLNDLSKSQWSNLTNDIFEDIPTLEELKRLLDDSTFATIACDSNGQVVAVGILSKISKSEGQLKCMAIDVSHGNMMISQVHKSSTHPTLKVIIVSKPKEKPDIFQEKYGCNYDIRCCSPLWWDAPSINLRQIVYESLTKAAFPLANFQRAVNIGAQLKIPFKIGPENRCKISEPHTAVGKNAIKNTGLADTNEVIAIGTKIDHMNEVVEYEIDCKKLLELKATADFDSTNKHDSIERSLDLANIPNSKQLTGTRTFIKFSPDCHKNINGCSNEITRLRCFQTAETEPISTMAKGKIEGILQLDSCDDTPKATGFCLFVITNHCGSDDKEDEILKVAQEKAGTIVGLNTNSAEPDDALNLLQRCMREFALDRITVRLKRFTELENAFRTAFNKVFVRTVLIRPIYSARIPEADTKESDPSDLKMWVDEFVA